MNEICIWHTQKDFKNWLNDKTSEYNCKCRIVIEQLCLYCVPQGFVLGLVVWLVTLILKVTDFFKLYEEVSHTLG